MNNNTSYDENEPNGCNKVTPEQIVGNFSNSAVSNEKQPQGKDNHNRLQQVIQEQKENQTAHHTQEYCNIPKQMTAGEKKRAIAQYKNQQKAQVKSALTAVQDDLEELEFEEHLETPSAKESLHEINVTMQKIYSQLENINENPYEEVEIIVKKHTPFGIFLTIELVLLVIIFMLFMGCQLFGLVPKVVLSGSMEPNIHVGSVAYINTNVKPSDLKVGDVAARKVDDGSIEVMHRVHEITPEGNFIFKGDNNENVDLGEAIPLSIIGKEVFSVPYVGYVMQAFMDNKLYFVIGIVVANLFIWGICTLFTKREPDMVIGKNDDVHVSKNSSGNK